MCKICNFIYELTCDYLLCLRKSNKDIILMIRNIIRSETISLGVNIVEYESKFIKRKFRPVWQICNKLLYVIYQRIPLHLLDICKRILFTELNQHVVPETYIKRNYSSNCSKLYIHCKSEYDN